MYTLNLLDIKSEVRGKIHNSSLSANKLVRWANITQDYVWSYADLKSAQYTTTFDCVADQEIYYVDANVGRITAMSNTSNDWTMEEVSERDMNSSDPSRDETGTPERYSIFGKSEVSAQNAAASQITVVSSAADVTQYVRIIGMVSGVETAENVLLVGTVAQTTTATFDANGIIGNRLSASCIGNVTVTAGAASIVVIPIGKLFKMYQPVRLSPIPSSTDTIRVNYIQGPRPMISDYDIPDLPPEYHHIIPIGVLAQAHDEMYEFDIAEVLYGKLDKAIANLKGKDSSIRGNARSIKIRGLRSGKFFYGKYPTTVG